MYQNDVDIIDITDEQDADDNWDEYDGEILGPEYSDEEKAMLEVAIEMIVSTNAFKYRQYDSDFNLTRGVYGIQQFLAGNEWQS